VPSKMPQRVPYAAAQNHLKRSPAVRRPSWAAGIRSLMTCFQPSASVISSLFSAARATSVDSHDRVFNLATRQCATVGSTPSKL
jgi:hypothetical protein